MPKLKREFFDGKSKFTVRGYSNFYDGRHHRDEWDISREFKTGQLASSQKFCTFIGTRGEALKVASALNSIFRMREARKVDIGVLKAMNETQELMKSNFDELCRQHGVIEADLKEKTTIVDALMIELRSQRVELTREHETKVAKLVQDVDRKAGTIKYLEEQLGIARRDAGNHLFATKRQLKKRREAEALIGRIIIKRDRRKRNEATR